ncbi:uncharacterized protein [Channa argus]|uniref:uncharacterized protein n=1 Tax=Channa argus TaxID=215402 RepID=UPI002948101B|nr:hypothetical protein Q8A73_023092 [Channa argus]
MWDGSRTVVVSGVPDPLPVFRMADKLTVHFQSRRRSDGGDVEVVTYPTNLTGVAFVTFEQAEDAERVVRKEQHIMTDSAFPAEYLLTVFPFTRDVFLYVSSATVDLSVFGSDQASLIQSLQSAHRSVRFQPLSHERKATVEGPFAAVKALREDLIRRAGQFKSVLSAPTATVKLRESALNPRVISHHNFVGSVNCSKSKAEREPAGSNGLSVLLQSTGEESEVQSLLSNAKPQNSARQKAQSFCDTEEDEVEQLRAGSRHKITTDYRPERAKASPRHMLREEIDADIRSSLSGLYLLPTEKISAKQTAVEDVSQKHIGSDRISTTKTKGRNDIESCYSNSDYLKESHQSSSSVTAKLLKTSLKDVSVLKKGLFAACPENTEDACIWVDMHVFRYIEKFEKDEYDKCLRGLDSSVEEVDGTDLMRICLSDNQPTKAASKVQQALENLKTLVEHWQSQLRVHRISYDKKEQRSEERLIQVCSDVNIIFNDVLYMFKNSCIKVIGTSTTAYLFCQTVEDRLRSNRFL